VKTNYLAALIALLALSTAAPSFAQRATTGSSSSSSHTASSEPSRDKASSVAMRPDILKWSAYEGAELVKQVSLSESQLKALASKIPAEDRKHLRGLKYVAVVSYRLRGTAPLKDVIAFYEPRVLAAGYKLFSKDFSEPEEASAMYAGPKEAFLVFSAENEGEDGRTLEIVSVEGPLDSLASMGVVRKKTKGVGMPKTSTHGPLPTPKPAGKRQ
jgi:hypothetical protein